MKADAASQLEALLDQMRAAILVGDLQALVPLGQETDRVLAEPLSIGQHEARRLREKATQNLVCLSAAARGVRSARRRLTEVQAAASGALSTYDENGQRAETGRATTLVQRF